MTRNNDWVWLPHPAHFICADRCRFRLATKVADWIISTVGEYYPDEDGEMQDIGADRKYETMVFLAKRNRPDSRCCPWIVADHQELQLEEYNDPKAAYDGHMRICAEWDRK